MVKNIKNLTKIFSKDVFKRFNLIDEKTGKMNTKSTFFWLFVIVIFAVSLVSIKTIGFLITIKQPEIFLNIFFLIMSIIMIFQVSLSATNVFYFSEDMEALLPLPIKPKEFLIAKFNTILINLYLSEIIFAFFPLCIYGFLVNVNIIYFVKVLIILLIFPIMNIIVVTTIIMFMMKLLKFIKNKNIFQILVTLIFVTLILFFEVKIITNIFKYADTSNEIMIKTFKSNIASLNDKLKEINRYFIQVNLTTDILENKNILNNIFLFTKIVSIDMLLMIVFLIIGEKTYLKDILRNNSFDNKKNYNKLKDRKIKYKKKNKKIAYIENEFKLLLKNPIFFMQGFFPIIMLVSTLFIIICTCTPIIRAVIEAENMNICVEIALICVITGIIQIILSISNISLTGFSRQGKTIANIMKTIPISFYEQFKCKTQPQNIINTIVIFIICILIKIIFPEINNINILFIFIINIILSIIQSNLMLIIDLNNPNLNWESEYEVIKQNKNKIYSYIFNIIIFIILAYFAKALKGLNLELSCFIITSILLIIYNIMNIIIKNKINKLFNNIN